MTYDEIMERMLSNVPDSFDKREGSIIWDSLSPCAIELNNLYIEFENMLNEAFGDTASREYLERLCAERAITPEVATKAVLKGLFTPANVEIAIGARFNSSAASYTVIEKISDGVYKLECDTAGVIGNSYTGTILPIAYIQGLETATIDSILIYGEDEETTEALRARYLKSFNERSFAGNHQDYIDKCLAVGGVGACKVESAWDGGGTVRLTILDSEYGAATDELITKVKDLFDPNSDGKGDGLAPIGHVVTVRSAESVAVNVVTAITFESGYTWEQLKDSIETSLKNYLLSLRKEWQDESGLVVRVAQLESRILGIVGISDIANTKINGSTANLNLTEYQIPVFGGISSET